MSGHSKWSKIKRKKGVSDVKRGKIFSKIIRELTVAARIGGGNPDDNPRLRLVIDKAKAANMPSDNIQRAIKKGSGELGGETIEEFSLEGYGPGGVAVLVETMTNNHNRTVAEIRFLFSRHQGNLGEAGCVNWLFTKKGVLSFPKTIAEEKIMEVALEAGADDIQTSDESIDIYTASNDLDIVRKSFEGKGLKPNEMSFQMIPQNTIHLEGDKAKAMLELMEVLEDHEDVKEVHANFDIDASVMEEMEG